MEPICTRQIVLAMLVIGMLCAVAHSARAVSCGDVGATVTVVIHNPTDADVETGVSISGATINGQTTCTDADSSYSKTTNVVLAANDDTPFTFTDLNSGMWVHTISVSIGSNVYSEYQKGVVLKAPDSAANPNSKVRWMYFPNSINVKTTGDSHTESCGTYCTFRQALTAANALSTSESNPALIFFTASSGAMSSGALNIIGDYITIDGTNSSGNPWIVGDALATQDSFPTVIDLANTTHLSVYGSHTTLKGLSIVNTTSSGTPQYTLISDNSGATNTTIDSVRLDGGAGSVSSCSSCLNDLIHLNETGATITNVEGRSAYGYGMNISLGGTAPTITDSWFHHNLNDNLYVNDASISRNMIELAGYRALDNTRINSGADGIFGAGGSNITTSRNVVRNNSFAGLEVTAAANQTPALSLSHDYVCGSEPSGSFAAITVYGGGGPANGTGLAVVYNDGDGVLFDNNVDAAMTFDNDSAFTANDGYGIVNDSDSITVSAENNQWRGVTGDPLPSCTTSGDVVGDVDCDPAQDYLEVPVEIDDTEPVVPSNVIRSGQTIRVQGTGFNAIDGNPLAEDANCTTGPNPVATPTNCCRKTDKANTCDESDPPKGVQGMGNCVAIKDRAGDWNVASPTGVTPTTITTGLPNSIACIGQFSELVRVSKRIDQNTTLSDEADYCTNHAPK